MAGYRLTKNLLPGMSQSRRILIDEQEGTFDRCKSFDHDDLTTKHCYFRCSRPPEVDGIKILDKDDQAAKHRHLNVLQPVYLTKNLIPSMSGSLEHSK